MRILVVNAGSSSTKLRVVDDNDRVSASADLGPPGPDLVDRLGEFVAGAGLLDAAGHRVVHGGERLTEPVIVDGAVRGELETLATLAPLHNPPALAAIDALGRWSPALPSVACFDTAFHASLPVEVSSYALPVEWITRWGIRRYGFHGLSCTWAVTRAAELLDRPSVHRLVVCHLGAGASVTAVLDGRSVDTTMGFTPLEGLVMATRPGDVDPGVISWLLHHGISLDELDDALEHRSGLAALSGEAKGDMRIVLERRSRGDDRAATAVEVYLHRLRAKIAGMTAAMGGLDGLVFTGGVAERSSAMRAEACTGLNWLGVELDGDANVHVGDDDAVIGRPGLTVATMVVHAREELVIAAATRRLVTERT
ncbi:MAG: acetate/propionate family kinase [Actinomycetota bacterium]|nr:acetate/propionate family kinase [Actinomycetota bacterium]